MFTNNKNKFKTYSLDKFEEETLSYLLSSKVNGMWGVEFNGRELCLITPPYLKLNNEIKGIKKPQGKIFSVRLGEASFLPLSNSLVKLFSSLKEQDIFIQILFKKVPKSYMVNTVLNQYEEYLKGNDIPSHNKFIRKGQRKILNLLEKFVDVEKKDRIDEAEEKILSDCHYFNFNAISNHIEKLEELLCNQTYYNHFVIQEESILEDIAERNFDDSYKQFLSETEIKAILLDDVELSNQNRKENTIKRTSINPIQTGSILNKAANMLPSKEKSSEEISGFINQIHSVFKQLKLNPSNKLSIHESFQGTTLNKIQFKIPKDKTYTDIHKKLKDIQAALGNQNIDIEIGNHPNTFNLYAPRHNRDVLYLKSIIESVECREFISKSTLPLIFGEDTEGKILLYDLEQLKHILIAGATGSGKSVFLNILILSLIISVESSMIKFFLIDPKNVEFPVYKDFPQVQEIITEPQKAVNTVNALVAEMERRYKIIGGAGVRNIKQYNEKSKDKLPYIVCVIDEFADLMMTDNEVESYVVRIAQKARAAGIHLIIATQKPYADVVTGLIKANLPSAISFRLNGSNDYRTVFGTGIPYTLLGKGDGAAKIEGEQKEFIRFQSPTIDVDESNTTELIKNIGELFKNTHSDEIQLIDDTEEIESLDKLKTIVATTRETRIKELQKQMGIRINEVSDLVKQLVDEQWIEKDGRSYKIIASEEELNKWRGSNV